MDILNDWVNTYPLLTYTASAAFFIGLILVVVSYFLAKRRIDRIQEWKKFDVVPPPAEVAKHIGLENPREQALVSINTHLMNTRRLLFPFLVMLILIIVAIPYAGEDSSTVISILVGALTIVVGTAVKPIVENFFAGLVLGFSKLLNIGDLVEVNGVIATVEDINMTHTTLKRWDWTRYIIPNSKMLQLDYSSWTLNEVLVQAHSDFWVSFDTDLDFLEHECLATLESMGLASSQDPGQFRVLELHEHGVFCRLAIWTESSEIWATRHALRKAIVKTLQEKGIKTPINRIRYDYPESKSVNFESSAEQS